MDFQNNLYPRDTKVRESTVFNFKWKEIAMTPTATLEAPVIEDTLFGEDLAAEVKDEAPDSCFCICSCPTRAARTTNNSTSNMAADIGE